ncbi:hypothetical protein BGZ70_008131 [Mortierella alpina]|uniref:Uncharacterized protein n=1 Tax=Mortierella alpina TaxID=64518 RepID=A0A9P6J7F6_MORAP|nr:hypothetical protein BGZ70_008131 [Mortierella alpina]
MEQGAYIAYATLTTAAVVSIYAGSFASLRRWKNPEDKRRAIKKQVGDSDDEQDGSGMSENVSLGNALLSPVLGSIVLYGLHHAMGLRDLTYARMAVATYFNVLGMFAMAQVGVNVLTAISQLLGFELESWHINLAHRSKGYYSARFTVVHLIMLVASVLTTGYYAVTQHWIVSNVFGISLALSAIPLFALDSFKTGLVFLMGLTLHDVAWAMEAKVLASVARSFSLPLKVVFPRMLLGLPAGQAYQFVALSLGDVAIPGIFAALCLRFDQHRAGTRNPALGASTGFRKPYFVACLVAYALGLGSYFYTTHLFKMSQPALLYVAAACILSVFMTAIVRGEMKPLFGYVSEAGQKI